MHDCSQAGSIIGFSTTCHCYSPPFHTAQTNHSDLEIIQRDLTNDEEKVVVGITTVRKGRNYKFECREISGSTDLQWVYEDRDGSLGAYTTGSGVAFNLTNFMEADQGLYRCEKSGTQVTETIKITLSEWHWHLLGVNWSTYHRSHLGPLY